MKIGKTFANITKFVRKRCLFFLKDVHSVSSEDDSDVDARGGEPK